MYGAETSAAGLRSPSSSPSYKGKLLPLKKRHGGVGGGKKPVADWGCRKSRSRWRCKRPTIQGYSGGRGHYWCEEGKLIPPKKRITNKLRPRTKTEKEQKVSFNKTTRNKEKVEGDAVAEKHESKKRDGGGGRKKPVADSHCRRRGGGGWMCKLSPLLGDFYCEKHREYQRNYVRNQNQHNGPKKNIYKFKKAADPKRKEFKKVYTATS